MTYKEQVIKGLEHCDFGVSDPCYEKECPYYQSHDCTDELKNDILVLLKEQYAVRPDYEPTTLSWSCGNCGQPFDRCKYKYCPNCGQAVKWDD